MAQFTAAQAKQLMTQMAALCKRGIDANLLDEVVIEVARETGQDEAQVRRVVESAQLVAAGRLTLAAGIKRARQVAPGAR